jgi:hypothetical protein
MGTYVQDDIAFGGGKNIFHGHLCDLRLLVVGLSERRHGGLVIPDTATVSNVMRSGAAYDWLHAMGAPYMCSIAVQPKNQILAFLCFAQRAF